MGRIQANLEMRLAMKWVAIVFSIMFCFLGGQTRIPRRNEISTAKRRCSLLTERISTAK